MRKLGVAVAIAIASAGAARAADLPTTKAPAAAPPVNCFASFWNWLDSTAADCPLSYGPFTAYMTLDYGVGWESHGAGYNAAWNNGVSNIVTKQSGIHSQWLQTPNGLSQSVVGVKMSQPLPWGGWSIVGDWEMGFNPMWGYLADAQRSQVQNNGKALTLQNANADSSRTGQWDNSQAFLGVSNPIYGTLTAGRVYTLSLDAINSYDPMGGSYAFSPIGYSGSYAGFGDTEAARVNTGVKYRLNYQNYRVAGLVQWGGYDQGNGTNAYYQGQIGGDFHLFGGTPFAGALSVDAIGSWAKDAVNVGTFTGSCGTVTTGAFKGQTACASGLPQFYGATDVTATLSNNTGLMLVGKYKWDALTLYGGYAWLRQTNPSDDYLNGFTTIGGWNVPATIPSTFPNAKKFWPTQWTSYTTYNIPRIAPFFWVGAKYAITPQLDVTGAFYWLQQTDYNGPTPCTPANTTFTEPNGYKFTVTRINSGKCAGQTDFISALLDYRPVKRVDLYAGIMISNVYGGLANGYQVAQTVNPTAGIRIKF
jgi:predicted porin